ncbi:unnamed protein product [Euphydryas editha]|uniref:Glucuronosyltransferase n=1 Tax=Euphydryas editha TaxID=104508 RepID=A0AAU9UH06_EUPED|nr:unnamed protein product [Euphydryas editha]
MFKFIICLCLVFIGSECAKILGVFPTPAISHQVVFRPVMIELAKRGHEVTMITTDPAFSKGDAPANFTEINVRDASYAHWNSFIAKYGEEIKSDPITYTKLLCKLLLTVVETQIKSPEVQKLFRDKKKFDLIFSESYMRPGLIYSHIYDAPVIEFSSLSGFHAAFEMIGAATHPIIYPNPFHKRIYNLTLWEKIKKLYIHFTTERIFADHIHVEDKLFKEMFGPDTPSISDLRQKVQMLFLNVHPVWDFNRPVPPNVVYLGRLHQNPKRELPEEWKSYLDSSKNGVIYVSFGTNVKPSMFPPETIKIFTNVFSKLPYDIVWKWDNEDLPGRPKNVRISKWMPQSDLLRHPKVKLYILQGGLQSTDEALSAGVPVIGIPMLGDQWFNIEQYVKFNIGKGLLLESLTEESLLDAITTIINDDSYRQNVIKLYNFMKDEQQPSVERAVWWTEYVLRHSKSGYLRTPGANISWSEYYELEVVLVLLGALVTLLAFIVLAIRFIILKIRHYMRGKVKIN